MSSRHGSERMSRRRFLGGVAMVAAASVLGACATPQPTPAPTEAAPQPTAAVETGPTAMPVPEQVDWLHAPDISQMPKTTIRYWFYETPERIALGKQQVGLFSKIFPNITVDGRSAPEATDNQMLLAYIKAGTNSHVHQSVCNEDTYYITHDLLLPLEDLPGFKEVWDRMNPNLNYTWRDGHVYAISWYDDPIVIFYNKKVITEAGLDPTKPPETYSEFLSWAEAVAKIGKSFYSLTTGEEWWEWEFAMYPFYIAATGSNQLHSDDGTRAVFNTPEFVGVYDLVNTLVTKGYNLTDSGQDDPWFAGRLAATIQGMWQLQYIQRYAPDGFEFFVGPIPKPDNSKVAGNLTWNFVREFVLMREQQKQGEEADRINRAAWEFMKFLLSTEELAADYAAQGEFPCEKNWYDNPVYSDTIGGYGEDVVKWCAAYGANSPIYDMRTHLECESQGILQQSYLSVFYQKMKPAEAVKWAEDEVNKILAAG